jgi:outer membrane lipoprotein SlyB
MANKQPSDTDRFIGHSLVALLGGYVGSRIGGVTGFIVGAIVGIVAHHELDEPVPRIVGRAGLTDRSTVRTAL